MKKNTINTLATLLIVCLFSSCATVFGGKVTVAQRTKPAAGEPSRSIRPVAMIADIILFWPGLIVDFATGAIYRPEGNGVTTQKAVQKN
jgi:hypothetical protein